MPPSKRAIEQARTVRQQLAGASLAPSIAKLYSQHTRLRYHADGLVGWRGDEAERRIEDAVRLIEAGFAERDGNGELWQRSMSRAGEILEWLSHPELNERKLPLRLLAAAAYQLAGYPARSVSLLNETIPLGTESEILESFLQADFAALIQRIATYWQRKLLTAPGKVDEPPQEAMLDEVIGDQVVTEAVRALGVIWADLRWGDDQRSQMAIEKLRDIAGLLLHGRDSYSWLIAKLCAEVAARYLQSSLRVQTKSIATRLTEEGRAAVERYLRVSFLTKKALAWPSQIGGISRLESGNSFALCTPTGSGKTTIAELAILDSLFRQRDENRPSPEMTLNAAGPIAMYLVPSRALAAEVEAKLSRVLSRATGNSLVITGLYGGTDWGPTDAWLTSDSRAVLICTYEKGEAILRFLRPLFVSRLSLLVIDEAHAVEFGTDVASLVRGESRALRLESLGTRLLMQMANRPSRVIALSAVAAGLQDVLAEWITGDRDAKAYGSGYRSTRQLVGRLECHQTGSYEIVYDLLDGADVKFEEAGRSGSPFIPRPFTACPIFPTLENSATARRLSPQLLWAAMNLAAVDEAGLFRAVLISVTEHPDYYATDFLTILDVTWIGVKKPLFFVPPTDSDLSVLWERCLASCNDYFGSDSREYKLLRHGIALHHGKMPGLLARLLVEVVEARIVNIVLATSTLSEGVNLPFETVLIPSLTRRRGPSEQRISVREFGNLVGRAGRPGVATEGRSLVLIQVGASPGGGDGGRMRNEYQSLVNELRQETNRSVALQPVRSPLAHLLSRIHQVWNEHLAPPTGATFVEWLEKCSPSTVTTARGDGFVETAETDLDSLDGVLLAILAELDQVGDPKADAESLEDGLIRAWQHTFATFASAEEQQLRKYFVTRGQALRNRIYPDPQQRGRLYRTSLAPRFGRQLLDQMPSIRSQIGSGNLYASWDNQRRLTYIQSIVEVIGAVESFRARETVGNSKTHWSDVLVWWLDPAGPHQKPSAAQVSTWYDFVNQQFIYRFNWGLGSVISLAIYEAAGSQIQETHLEDWKLTGLPWVAFWLKELLTWGTLDPVAAFLLATRRSYTRSSAQALAAGYFQDAKGVAADDVLDPRSIRNWCEARLPPRGRPSHQAARQVVDALPTRDFREFRGSPLRVIPIEDGQKVIWVDVAGYSLAESQRGPWLSEVELAATDFVFDPRLAQVAITTYV